MYEPKNWSRVVIFLHVVLLSSSCEGPVGPAGAPGQDGVPCYEGLDDVNGDGVVDVLDCRGRDGLDGQDALNGWPVLSEEEIAAIKSREGVAECIGCHEATSPNMVDEFVHSGMAIRGGVACVDCHEASGGVPPGHEGHRLLPTPETCGACHPNEYKGHRANRHSVASIRNYECGRFDDFPRVFESGAGYHFNEQDLEQLQELLANNDAGPGADYNPTVVAMCMQCHNVENRCDSCHTRHRFSPAEARNPAACGTCHMGPDHPQIEMYETSKHGVMFAVEGDTARVPVCVDCHMPYNGKIFPRKKDEQGREFVSHDLSATIAYGPVGGGTVRKGFVSENGRVKMVSREPAGVAAYEELWYDWSDGRVYTSSSGSEVAFDDIYQMSIADEDGNGRQDYKLAQPTDPPERLERARQLMLDVCNRCHARNFADERLLIADYIHENAKMVQMEAFDIITALAAADIGPYSSDSDRPVNPENGNNDPLVNMKIRNLTALEKEYFHAMKYDQIKTWKGAYHFNPDYAHWYGWTELNMRLGEIGDMATQQVLLDLWVRGEPYPGPNKDIFSDGLYQGVLYVNGIEETRQVENYYDKFPGTGDDYLDWLDANLQTYNTGGDGVADNGQDIDIDMDGNPDLVKDDGQGGTLPAGKYRAPATGKVLTFH